MSDKNNLQIYPCSFYQFLVFELVHQIVLLSGIVVDLPIRDDPPHQELFLLFLPK
jgi:hypothetical protein